MLEDITLEDLEDEIRELKERLINANYTLSEMAAKTDNLILKSHFESKRQGVALALEYMRSVHYG